MNLDFTELLEFYRDHTYNNLMAYWMKRLDTENGGVFNCLNNRGDRLLHEHKFVWSQGRWAYTTAQLYARTEGELGEDVRAAYLETSRATSHFLMDHARLENGNCAFVLSRDGRPIMIGEDGSERERRDGEVYDYSISADCFALYGVGEYARVSGEEAAYRWARDLYLSWDRRLENGTARLDYPYPVPAGYVTHDSRMERIEAGRSLAGAADRFGDTAMATAARDRARQAMNEVMEIFVQPDGLVLEMLGEDCKPVDTLLGRYCNPGHTIEDMWFIMQLARDLGDEDVVARAAEVTRATCEKAWDHEVAGGVPQFVDRDTGYQPTGNVPPEIEDAVMVHKLRNLWDKKLWWPHSEALYALLLAYELTGEAWTLDWFARFHEYTFNTFPNPDREVGEWIQIRNRQGQPEDAVVALPVKDPMHIIRAFQHTIDTLKRLLAGN